MSTAQKLSTSKETGYQTMEVRAIAGALGAEIYGEIGRAHV